MASSVSSAVYIHVIEDVIDKVRDEFINDGGPGEAVLNELQGLWEMKMMQAGALCIPIERSAAPKTTTGGSITPVGDLNMPYEGIEEYETPTAEILFPPTPLQTSYQTPLPGATDNSPFNIPTGTSDNSAANDTGSVTETKVGRPSPYMQVPSPWMNQRPPLSVDVNVAYEDGHEEAGRGASHQTSTQDLFMGPPGKRKRSESASQYQSGGGYIPQQDGAGESALEVFQVASQRSNSLDKHDTEKYTQVANLISSIPQLDGPATDPHDNVLSTPNIYNYEGVVNEDYNVVNTPAPNGTPAAAPIQNDAANSDDSEPSLNEDDDDDDLDDVDQGDDLNTQHLVLAQFDKVTRTKSRWKCTLKNGIMHINDKDVLFNKANGEFEF